MPILFNFTINNIIVSFTYKYKKDRLTLNK